MALRLPTVNAGTVVRLLVASLIVGAALYWLDLTPRDLLGYATGLLREVVQGAATWIGTGVTYILLGAVIVIPIWLLSLLFRSFKR